MGPGYVYRNTDTQIKKQIRNIYILHLSRKYVEYEVITSKNNLYIHTCRTSQRKNKQSFWGKTDWQLNENLLSNLSAQIAKLVSCLSSRIILYGSMTSKCKKVLNVCVDDWIVVRFQVNYFWAYVARLNISFRGHFFGVKSPWAHLLNNGSFNSVCLSTIWLRNDLNFAHIFLSFPEWVDVALQYRWFSNCFVHSTRSSQPVSFANLDNTFTQLWIKICLYVNVIKPSPTN